jgi:hypothetical protein
MPAAIVLRIVVAVAASVLWSSTGRAGEQIVEGLTVLLLPGLMAVAQLLAELAAIVAVAWVAVLAVRRARRCRRGGDRDSR